MEIARRMIEPVNHQSSLGFSAKEEINRGPSCVAGDMRALSVLMIRDVKRKIRTMMKSNAIVGANVQYVRFWCKCAKLRVRTFSWLTSFQESRIRHSGRPLRAESPARHPRCENLRMAVEDFDLLQKAADNLWPSSRRAPLS